MNISLFEDIRKEFSVDASGITYSTKRGLGRLCGVSASAWGQNGYLFNKELDNFIIQELNLEVEDQNIILLEILISKGLVIVKKQKYLITEKLAYVVINYYQRKEGVVLKKKQKKEKQGYIYLIKNNNTGNVKIGFSANPCKRLETLQTATDCELELLSFKKGTIQDEKKLHKRFDIYLIRNEWFKYSPFIASEFGMMQKQICTINTPSRN